LMGCEFQGHFVSTVAVRMMRTKMRMTSSTRAPRLLWGIAR
jgi:hypothetical protein